MIRRLSRHSRRSVPIQRSAIAFARGARTGVRTMRIFGTGENCVEGGGERAVPVVDQEVELLGTVAQVHQQVAGLLGDPAAGGVGGDPGGVCSAGPVLEVLGGLGAPKQHDKVEHPQEDQTRPAAAARNRSYPTAENRLSPLVSRLAEFWNPQDLDVLGCLGSGVQRQPTQHAAEHQVGEPKGHW